MVLQQLYIKRPWLHDIHLWLQGLSQTASDLCLTSWTVSAPAALGQSASEQGEVFVDPDRIVLSVSNVHHLDDDGIVSEAQVVEDRHAPEDIDAG